MGGVFIKAIQILRHSNCLRSEMFAVAVILQFIRRFGVPQTVNF
jgi:hypothetical protein